MYVSEESNIMDYQFLKVCLSLFVEKLGEPLGQVCRYVTLWKASYR